MSFWLTGPAETGCSSRIEGEKLLKAVGETRGMFGHLCCRSVFEDEADVSGLIMVDN